MVPTIFRQNVAFVAPSLSGTAGRNGWCRQYLHAFSTTMAL
jgi:hypothetical protein